MQLQVALDRLSLDEALALAERVHPYADWLEVGTSLIKEFGMDAVRRLRHALPDARILADAKTMDEGAYEFTLCYAAGADSVTVMGVAPDATLLTCATVAQRLRKQMTIDLLGSGWARQERLLQLFTAARFDWHVGKDTRQSSGTDAPMLWPVISCEAAGRAIGIAGGLTLRDIPLLGARYPEATVVVGSAITRASDAAAAARAFVEAMAPWHAVGGRA